MGRKTETMLNDAGRIHKEEKNKLQAIINNKAVEMNAMRKEVDMRRIKMKDLEYQIENHRASAEA